jgi:predicted ATP-binding protein involved in virulence
MKIRKLSIKNYKVFDDVEFDFTDTAGRTLDTVVLAGVNGCGKTTVLEFIKDIFSGNFNNTFSIYPEIAVDIELVLTDAELKNLVSRSIAPNFEVDIQHDPQLLRLNTNNIGLFSQWIRTQPNALTYFPISANDTNFDTERSWINILSIFFDRQNMKTFALKGIRDLIFKNRELPPQDSIRNYVQEVSAALEGVGLQTRLVDLESEELVFESVNGKRIYFENLSHGEQQLYFRAIYLSQLKLSNSIIMVDEPEAAFHPAWQQKVEQIFHNAGRDNQVFIATHSPHIMASVPPESLFVLHVEEVTRKIKVLNMAKEGKHSQGVEPNRILREIMQVESLRDYETQQNIEKITKMLTLEHFESAETEVLIEKLTSQLGRQDAFIVRLEHQLLVLNRKKQALATAS